MYGALPQWAVGGDVVAISDPHSPDIHLFDQWGILRRIVRMDWEATPVTRSMVDRYREAAWEPGRADTIEPWISQFPAADSVARHGALMVDQSGRLWVEDYKPVELAPTDEPSWWTVFDRNGLLAFRIELPSRSKLPVFQIDATSILSRSVDELGVQRITLWRMGPRPG
jgi:hypothetical protein